MNEDVFMSEFIEGMSDNELDIFSNSIRDYFETEEKIEEGEDII